MVKHVYEPVGFCIYCGAKDGLTVEHIIPFGLGGNLELPDASCRACATITGRVEQTCLRPMFGPTRIALDLPTRRKHERPRDLKLRLINEAGESRYEDVPVADHPKALFMPTFDRARLLWETPEAMTSPQRMGVWLYPSVDVLRVHNERFGDDGVDVAQLNPLTFVRMVAKIAHGYAYAEARGSFTPLLNRLILTDAKEMPAHQVGGSHRITEPEGCLHRIGLARLTTGSGRRYLMCEVRLFASLGAPRYHVVVGEDLAS